MYLAKGDNKRSAHVLELRFSYGILSTESVSIWWYLYTMMILSISEYYFDIKYGMLINNLGSILLFFNSHFLRRSRLSVVRVVVVVVAVHHDTSSSLTIHNRR